MHTHPFVRKINRSLKIVIDVHDRAGPKVVEVLVGAGMADKRVRSRCVPLGNIPQRAIGCLDNGVYGEPNEPSSKRRITGKVEDNPTTHSLVLRRAPYPDIDIVVRELGKGLQSPLAEPSPISTWARGMMRAVSRRSYSRSANSLRWSGCILRANNVAPFGR